MLKVIGIDAFPLTAWKTIDNCRPAPTFTARPAWALAWADCFPDHIPSPIRCILNDGSSVIVPLLRSKSRLRWNICIAMPWHEFTVVMHEDGRVASADAASASLKYLAERFCDSITITLWPLGSQKDVKLPGQVSVHELSVLDLAGGADAALSRMKRKSLRMAGQAERRGVTCSPEYGMAALETYYDMLLESALRWGLTSPTIPKRLLEAVIHYGAGDVEIWIARYRGEAIAGGVVLYGSDELYFWTAAMRAQFSVLRPSNALNVALVRAAALRGVRWYDLGSSFGLAGVARFKDSLGAIHVPYSTIQYRKPTYKIYCVLRSKIFRTNDSGH